MYNIHMHTVYNLTRYKNTNNSIYTDPSIKLVIHLEFRPQSIFIYPYPYKTLHLVVFLYFLIFQDPLILPNPLWILLFLSMSFWILFGSP